jgi:transcriptional regulator with XRE-family HTH domain
MRSGASRARSSTAAVTARSRRMRLRCFCQRIRQSVSTDTAATDTPTRSATAARCEPGNSRVARLPEDGARPIPQGAHVRMRFLVKQAKGSTRQVATRLGISQRTVERYVKGQLRRPRKDLAERMEREVRKDWQPRVQARARKQAATTTGIVVSLKGTFGYSGSPGSTDQDRLRTITEALPPQYAQRLFDAIDAGQNEDALLQIIGDGLRDTYFTEGGRRARSLEEVRINYLDYIDISYL